jgi:sulfur carrier protein ThiS adenylyltransferase
MNNFEKTIAAYLGDTNLKKLQSVSVGIAGCGGLGSNCANYLIRTGIKKLLVVDFDRVELSNLNRQFYFQKQLGHNKVDALKSNLLDINPDAQITALCQKLTPKNTPAVFSSCEIIVEAFDKAEQKKMLTETLLPLKKLIICASGLAGYGGSDRIKTRKIKDNLIIIGDLTSEVHAALAPLAPRVNVAAAKQADTVIDYILSKPF